MTASRACGADAAEINTGPYTSVADRVPRGGARPRRLPRHAPARSRVSRCSAATASTYVNVSADRRHSGDRRAQHRAQHRCPRGARRARACGARDGGAARIDERVAPAAGDGRHRRVAWRSSIVPVPPRAAGRPVAAAVCLCALLAARPPRVVTHGRFSGGRRHPAGRGSLRAAAQPAPAVVLVHMLTRSRLDWARDGRAPAGGRLAGPRASTCAGTVNPAAPSSRAAISHRCSATSQAAVAFLKSRNNVVAGRIGIAGASLGANLAVARRGGRSVDPIAGAALGQQRLPGPADRGRAAEGGPAGDARCRLGRSVCAALGRVARRDRRRAGRR